MTDPSGSDGVGRAPLIRAAEYVRMSTEHQRYSVRNQSDAIRLYAEQKGLRVVRTYIDAGRSGLRIEGRFGLQQLLSDVERSQADFGIVIVYDVNRRGVSQEC